MGRGHGGGGGDSGTVFVNGSGGGGGGGGHDVEEENDELGEMDESSTAKRQRLFGYVEEFWLLSNLEPDLVLQTFHTQYLWKDQEAATKALDERR